ncbi:hypothetical protein BKN38_04570 [Helicobacter sp. CLO-3]|uniref:DUF2726 domain-containing protein n=1 Tax=unclassified Helicobacter TaxID=2593540 RepID=UPI00080529E6|nr:MULTISPECIES: DUF2726 domain-containing protein [unclassified Helicobacter]OBV29817.1 hypothetical protein BA723_04065 [Helicobacter sp. CLO-3]OHU83967.1 hypothetical protein BKN38_04570 [Helicobacter sp. CLO-3]
MPNFNDFISVLIALACILAGFIILQRLRRIFYQIFYPKSARYQKPWQAQKGKSLSFGEKIDLISNAKLEAKNPLNLQEIEIFKALIFEKSLQNSFSILPQVAMKAFIKNPKDDEVWKTYAGFYVDFLLARRDFKNEKNTLAPVAVVEFYGSGHYGVDNPSEEHKKSVRNNDDIKKQILDKVGIKLFVIKGEMIYKYVDKKEEIDKDKLKAEIDKITQELCKA